MLDKSETAAVNNGALSSPKDTDNKRNNLIATGGILGAIAASSCCVLPLGLTLMGVSGAWMANLRALQPYQPIFIMLTVAFLAYGFYLVYWKPSLASSEGAVCARPVVSSSVVRSVLWLATGIVGLAATFNYWFPLVIPFLP